MTIADQLRAAADVLRRDGWTQGELHDFATGGHCALGAIETVRVEHGIGKAEEATDLFARVLRLPAGALDLAGWNDDPTNSAENVILALEFAALWWEQQQAQTAHAETILPASANW